MFGLFKTKKAPEDAAASRDFHMEVADVFSIRGRGTVVTGIVRRGSVQVGDEILVVRPSGQFRARVEGLEGYREMPAVAREGKNVGVLLQGVAHDQVAPGDLLTGL